MVYGVDYFSYMELRIQIMVKNSKDIIKKSSSYTVLAKFLPHYRIEKWTKIRCTVMRIMSL
jgi:hypothetical protein